jgi:hypothetical protein
MVPSRYHARSNSLCLYRSQHRRYAAEEGFVPFHVHEEGNNIMQSATGKPPRKTVGASNTVTKPRSRVVSLAERRAPAIPDKAPKPSKTDRTKKLKLVRDSFTMPEDEYALIVELKKRCLAAGIAAKKSEILRAAVVRLAQASDPLIIRAVRRLPAVKTGRPAKVSK